MKVAFGLVQNPQNPTEHVLMIGAQPEPWASPQVLDLLRMLKRGFPEEFRLVHYEMVLPVNGHSKLEIPEDIGGKSGG